MKALYIILFSFISVFASGQWTKVNGPIGGQVWSFIQHDSIVYASTSQEIYKSSDLGRTWGNIDAQLPGGIFYSSLVYFNNDLCLIQVKRMASGNTSNLYASYDGGKNFTSLFDSSTYFSVGKIDDTLFLARSPYYWSKSKKQTLYKSTDNGKSWSEMDQFGYYFRKIKSDGKRLYAIATDSFDYKSFILRSINNGITWDTVKGVLPYDEGKTDYTPIDLEISYSTIDTTLWITFNAYPAAINISTLLVLNQGEDSLRASPFPLQPDSIGDAIIGLLQFDGSTLTAATNKNIFQYHLEDKTWRDVTFNLFNNIVSPQNISAVRSVRFKDRSSVLVTVGPNNTLQRISDSDASYVRSDSGILSSVINNIVLHKNKLYVNSTYEDKHLFVSSDKGTIWESFLNPQEKPTYIEAMISTNNGVIIGGGLTTWLHTDSNTNHYSNTGGQTRLYACSGDTIYCLSSSDIFISGDGGFSWRTVDNMIPMRRFVESIITSKDKVFLGADSLVISNDAGGHWERVYGFPYKTSRWRALAYNKDTIYAGVLFYEGNEGYQGLFKSTDFGISWSLLSPKLSIDSTPLHTLILNDKVIFSVENALYRCGLNGENWERINVPFAYNYIYDIAVDSEDVYFGTRAYGLWRVSRSYLEGHQNSIHQNTSDNILVTVSPNPCTTEVTFRNLPSIEQIKVFNSLVSRSHLIKLPFLLEVIKLL